MGPGKGQRGRKVEGSEPSEDESEVGPEGTSYMRRKWRSLDLTALEGL